jgi:hypothetical protein
MVSCDGDNLVPFYYMFLSASEICHVIRGWPLVTVALLERYNCISKDILILTYRGRRGRDRMVVYGFTTTYAISAYHH